MEVKTNLKALSGDQVSRFIEEAGLPRYRTNQLLHWIYRKHASQFSAITEYSKDLRTRLEELAYISNLSVVRQQRSRDDTEKFLFALEDGQRIESVLIPDNDRLTLCVSSQVGCPMGCRFCLTGKTGFVRNLEAHEIVDQIISVGRIIGPQKRITNIVLMGMGEPLSNFDHVVEALRRMVNLVGISGRRITLSTAGIAHKIPLLGEKVPGVNLAVSLNATTDTSRSAIMPVNKKYPLRTLLDACRNFPLGAGRRITFEYVLIRGVNDSPEDAVRMVKMLKGLRCKVNLIPLNPYPESGFERSPDDRIRAFQEILIRSNLTALVRESKGGDILAACGQLRGAA